MSTEKAGLAVNRWSVSAVWLDYNNDGLLDVYVGNYLKYDDGKFRDFYPAAGYPGPLSYEGQPTMLFRNNGDGTFTDVTKEAGAFITGGRAMSVTAFDLNNHGCMDIFVANDAMENYYFENDCKGHFHREGARTRASRTASTVRASRRWARSSATSTATGCSTSTSRT